MITIREIAKICECSVATVNRALNNKPDISPETREKIIKATRLHGYRPHFMARSLARGRTEIIGLVVMDIHNPFFSQIIEYLKQGLTLRGYGLHLGITDGTPESEYRELELMLSMKVDGIIHCPLNVGQDYVSFLNGMHIPLVHFCNQIDDSFSFVSVKEREAMVQAVDLIEKDSYDTLIYVSPPLRNSGNRNLYTLEERLKGVQQAVRRTELCVIAEKDYINQSLDILFYRKGRCCFLCSSDIYALELMTKLREYKLVPPRDYGIMGFDDIAILHHLVPRLSTIAYPIREIAFRTLESIMSLIGGKKPSNYLLEARLIQGETIQKSLE